MGKQCGIGRNGDRPTLRGLTEFPADHPKVLPDS